MESIITHLDKIGISIAIPLVFTLCSALLETISSLVSGVGSENYKYKIWVKEQDNGEEIIRSIPKQSINSIQSNNNIIDIESMFFLDIVSFKSLGIMKKNLFSKLVLLKISLLEYLLVLII